MSDQPLIIEPKPAPLVVETGFDLCYPDDLTLLLLRPVTDPLTRQGLPERPLYIRVRKAIKACVRSYGLDVVSARFPRPRWVPCPKCRRPVDEVGRCAACEDWLCVCGKLTGSYLISLCWTCQLDLYRLGVDPDDK